MYFGDISLLSDENYLGFVTMYGRIEGGTVNLLLIRNGYICVKKFGSLRMLESVM
jgi:hypothetical protein